MSLKDKIIQLKKEKNAIILVHNYQRPEIYDVADFIGDSLGLCKEARKTKADLIIFCGVHFMAESAVILNPGKKVLVPRMDAGCAMADMIEPQDLIDFKAQHPEAAVVTYVNSSAEIKANSDICCTSANAVDVVRSLTENTILFVPDKNLAAYVAKKVPEKEIIAFDGFCPIHHHVSAEQVKAVRKENPNAKIIAHPESKPEVLAEADFVASTTGMEQAAKNSDAKEFFVLTECGMTERLKRRMPEKKFKGLCNLCYDMKKNDLEAIYDCMLSETNEVKVDPEIAKKALKAFDRMFEVS